MLTTATGSVITTMANTAMLGVSRVITTVIRTLATMAITRSGINAAIPIIIAAMDDGTRVSNIIEITDTTFTISR